MEPTTIGDGLVALAIAIGFLGYFYIKHLDRQKKLEIVHQERLVAMEKGIPLPEFPLEPPKIPAPPDRTTLPMIGTVFAALSIGAMVTLSIILPEGSRNFSVLPLPLTFLGIGLIAFHFMKDSVGR